MALVSILLAVLAFICTLVGFVTTPIPVLGLVFSFGAAAIALGGALLGGRAVSAAKQANLPADAARIAVVLNVIAFVPALLVALTCGVCNALFSTGHMQTQKSFDINFFNPRGAPGFGPDAGPGALPPPGHAPDGGLSPSAPPAPPPGPPGSLPPPPLPPGPGK